MNAKTVYRIENVEHMHGMWYDASGTFDPIIQGLCPNSLAKDLPMDYNPKHKMNKKDWYSAGKSVENMNYWFSRQDAETLLNNGFKLYKFVVTEFYEMEMECLFTREGVIEQTEIDIDEVWNKKGI